MPCLLTATRVDAMHAARSLSVLPMSDGYQSKHSTIAYMDKKVFLARWEHEGLIHDDGIGVGVGHDFIETYFSYQIYLNT